MSLSTKVFEYAALAKPVVASRLPMIARTFPTGTVAAYPPGDSRAMADAIVAFADDAGAREAAVARTMEIVRAGAWEHEAVRYLALVERLIRD